MEKQKTLAGSAFFSGIALHTGDRATVKMLPGEVNSGILFRRVDLPGAPWVRALASNVVGADFHIEDGHTIIRPTGSGIIKVTI